MTEKSIEFEGFARLSGGRGRRDEDGGEEIPTEDLDVVESCDGENWDE